jgi:predicted AlkP superfamily pyrophosphatase or phosphodiesterase
MPVLKKIENEILKSRQKGEFVYPYYEKYCISNIPSTISSILTGIREERALPENLFMDDIKKTEKIILFLIDGFGYHQWLRYFKGYEFFKTLTKNTNIVPLTSTFPSTTAAAITTINTGLNPDEHAIPEWVVYFREIDRVISTIPFSPIGMGVLDSLVSEGFDPKILYKGKNLYQKLKKGKVKSFAFQKDSIAYSAYSKVILNGSKIIPFKGHLDLVVKIRDALEKTKGPSYFYVYLDLIDAVSHKYGLYTKEYESAISSLSSILYQDFLKKVSRKIANETSIFITSDHGAVNIDPQKTIYLNYFAEMNKYYSRNRKGKIIPPTGSPRDVFLHIKDAKLKETKEFLKSKFSGIAEIVESKEAIGRGLFGLGRPTDRFTERIGNLMILPYGNHTIWYEHKKGERFKLRSHHGGLNPEEMMTYLAASKLSNLI